MNELEVAVTAMPATSWLEGVYWWSQILLTVIAAGTAAFAACQLLMIQKTTRQSEHLARATFLLDLDRRWDGAELRDARRLLVKLREDVSSVIATKHPLVNDRQREELFRADFAEVLRQIRSQDTENYMSLLSICGFFETAGIMVKRGFIDKDTILGLFRGPIVILGPCFRAHIIERQKETGVPNGLFEHALYLCDLATSEA